MEATRKTIPIGKITKWAVAIVFTLTIMVILGSVLISQRLGEMLTPTTFTMVTGEYTVLSKDPDKEWAEWEIKDKRLKYTLVLDFDPARAYTFPTPTPPNLVGQITNFAFILHPGQGVRSAEFRFERHKR